MKVVTLDSIVSVIRARRGYKKFLSEFINECKIVDAIPIPEGATNGQVMKAVFPTETFKLNSGFVENQFGRVGIEKDWWDAPYKAESE